MAEGFKLLDTYVEVTASGKGIAAQVGKEFESEIGPAAEKMTKSLSSALQTATMQNVAAKKREADATGSLRLAELSLAEARKKYPADSLNLIRAEERFAAAQRNSVAAVEASKRSMSTLGEAQRKMAAQVAENSKPSQSWGSSLIGDFKGFAMSAVGGLVGGLVGGVTSFAVTAVGNTIGQIGSMLTQVGSLVASTVIDFNSTLQNATIGFTTMLGSGEKSAAFLNELQDFAKSTPFEFKNLISNAQNMMGMGIAANKVIPYLRALGDSVASIGGSAAQVDQVTLAFDQMAAKGTLDMGNMNQLMQGGVPSALKILASAYKTTTGNMIGMISAGKVQADVALPALIRGIEKGTKSTAALGGMMDKQSTTFTGALSNIQDGLTQTTSKAFKPFFDVASKGMQQFAKALSGKPAQKFEKDVTAAMKPLAKGLGDWFKGIDFDKIFTDAANAVKGAIPAMTSFGKDVLPDIVHAFGEIGKAAPKVTKAVTAISKSVADAAPGWIEFAGNVASASTDFDKSLNKMSESTHNTSDDFDSFLNDAGKNIHGFASDVIGTVKNIGSGIMGFFADAGQWLMDAGANIITGLVSGINNSIHFVTDTVAHVADLVKGVFTGPKGIDSHSPSKVFEQYGRWINQGLQKGLLGSVDEVKEASNTLSDAVKSAFSTTNMTSTQEAGALKHIKHVTKELVSDAKARDKAVSALADAKDKLAGLKSDKASYGSDIRSNLRSGFEVGTLFGNGASDMATYMDSKADYASRMADYNKGLAGAQSDYTKGLADAQLADSRSSRGASVGTLDGHGYTASYSTQGGGTAVADFLRDNGSDSSAKFKADNELPTDNSGSKPLTGVARIKADLKKLLTDTKAFTANLKTLVKMGMDKTTLQQLIDAGPTAGLDITKDMIADPAGLKAIVGIQNDLYKAGTGLGAWASGQMYDSQISAAQKTVNSDTRAVNHYEITMQVDASKIDDITKMMNALKALSKTAKAAKAKK